MAEPENPADVTALTVQLLSAYLTNNTVASENLAELIRTTRAALTQDTAEAAPVGEPEVHTPAVSVRKSLSSAEYLVSLIDGKRYKTLKRHLASHGLTPEAYRERYGLPATYPMVAPAFAAMRRDIAGRIGLGRTRKPAQAPAPASVQTAAKIADEAAKPSEIATVVAAAPTAAATQVEVAKPASANVTPAKKNATPSQKAGKAPKASAAKKSDAAAPEAATPDARTPEKKVSRQRKAKPAADVAVLSADAATPVAPVGLTTPSTTAVAVKPKKAAAKRPSRGAAKPAEAKTDPAASSEAPAPDVAAEASAAASVTAAPKRRGKLGLFGKGQGAGDAVPAETAAGAKLAEPVTEQAKERKPAKVTKPKRMARSPRSDGTAAG